jgi:hypothetical protein
MWISTQYLLHFEWRDWQNNTPLLLNMIRCLDRRISCLIIVHTLQSTPLRIIIVYIPTNSHFVVNMNETSCTFKPVKQITKWWAFLLFWHSRHECIHHQYAIWTSDVIWNRLNFHLPIKYFFTLGWNDINAIRGYHWEKRCFVPKISIKNVIRWKMFVFRVAINESELVKFYFLYDCASIIFVSIIICCGCTICH